MILPTSTRKKPPKNSTINQTKNCYLISTDQFRYQLKKLREWRFKTFSPFIDESYDNVLDMDERFDMIEFEINRLCNRPIEKIHDWYWSIQQDLKHNYYHLKNQFIKNHTVTQ